MTDEFGRVAFEVLPSRRYVRVTVDGAQNEVRHDFASGSSEVRFATVPVYADEGVEVAQYYLRGWRPFIDGMEILPTRIYVGLADGSRPPRNQLTPGVVNFVPSGSTADLPARDRSDEPTAEVIPDSTTTTSGLTTTTTEAVTTTSADLEAATSSTDTTTDVAQADASTSSTVTTTGVAEPEATTSSTVTPTGVAEPEASTSSTDTTTSAEAESATTTTGASTTSAGQSEQVSESDSGDVGPTTTGGNSGGQPTPTTIAGDNPDLAIPGVSVLQRVELDDGVFWSAAENVTNALVVTLEPVEDDGDVGNDDVVKYALRVENVADVNVPAPVKFDIEFDETDEVQIEGNVDWDCEHHDGVVSCARAEDFEAAAVSIIIMSTSTPKPTQTGQLAVAFVSVLVVGLGALVITRRRHTGARTEPVEVPSGN